MQREFEKSIRHYAMRLSGSSILGNTQTITGSLMGATNQSRSDAVLTDLEGSTVQGVVPTISHHISLMNGQLKNQALSQMNVQHRGTNTKPARHMNGDINAGYNRSNFRQILQDTDRHAVDSYM